MKVGYVRVSTREQNTARQDVLMEQLGVEKVFTDKVSGKDIERPELQKMMDFVREGDSVTVESISRFARNTKDLLVLQEACTFVGTLGVPIFYVCAGFLFKRKNTFIEFWKNKFRKIIIPWMFCSLVVWFYHFIQGDDLDIFKFMFGFHSFYWYMPVLIIYFLLFYYIENKWLLSAILLISISYHILAYDFGLFTNIKSIAVIGSTLQFMPYFLMGFLLQSKKLELRMHGLLLNRISYLVACLFVCGIIAWHYTIHGYIRYDSPLFFLLTLAVMVLVYNIANYIQCGFCYKKRFIQIGKDSYTIYLLHSPLAGIFSNILSRNIITAHMILLYPIWIILIIEFGLSVLKRILKDKKSFFWTIIGNSKT